MDSVQDIIPARLTMHTGLSPVSPLHAVMVEWAGRIGDRTEGRVAIVVSSGSPTGYEPVGSRSVDSLPPGAPMPFLEAGSFDIRASNPALVPNNFPIAKTLPCFFQGVSVISARKVWNRLWDEFAEIRQEFDGRTVLFGHGVAGCVVGATRGPLHGLRDLAGLTLAPMVGFGGLLSRLGAVETPLVIDIFPELRDKRVDGAMFPAELLQSFAYGALVRHVLHLPLVCPPAGDYFYMDVDKWNTLPQAVQGVFEEERKWIETELDNVLTVSEQATFDWARSEGIEIARLPVEDLDEFRRIWGVSATDAANELDRQGFPGSTIFERTRQLCASTGT